MAIFDERSVSARETRLGTLTAFQGEASALRAELKNDAQVQIIRTLTQAGRDDILSALDLLATLRDAALVVHGVAGCAAGALAFYRDGREAAFYDGVWWTTALDERDTILGGDEKLRETVLRVFREQHPKAIFIIGTPAVAINNDDINSVVLELTDELAIPVISIKTDGFKSKNAVNGLDTALHAIGKHLVGAGGAKGAGAVSDVSVNLIAVSENRRGVDALAALIRALGAGARILPRYAAPEDIAGAGGALFSVAVNDSRSQVFLRGLAEKTGVTSIASGTPAGPRAVSDWLLTVGAALGCRERARILAETELNKWAGRFSEKPLAGRRVFVALGAGEAVEIALFLLELGAEITGISIDYADSSCFDALERLPDRLFVHVGNGQPYELAAIFAKNRPDYFIAGENAAWVTAFGIVPVPAGGQALYGYSGAEELFRTILAACRRQNLAAYIADGGPSIYKEGWLKKSANWHIKREAR
jgi:nitrogenase molybdenum-iron protein alpha chain